MTRHPKRGRVTSELAALHVRQCGGKVSPATIRQWARRKRINTYREGGVIGGVYDLREVEAYARERGLIA